MKIKLVCVSTLIGLTALMIYSCSKTNSSSYGNTASNGTTNGNSISISNMAFSSTSISVNKNTTVTWTNYDYMSHTVTADDNTFTSPTLGYGDTYSRTFSITGSFPYHCNVHSSMKGTVVVK
jgi:plastocyanin